MHLAKASLLFLTAVTGTNAAIEWSWWIQHISEVQNGFFSFESKVQTIVDLKSGLRAMNAVQNFFQQGVDSAEYIQSQISGSKFTLPQQSVVCTQLDTMMAVEEDALQLFASKAPNVQGASPAMYQTYQNSTADLQNAETNMYRALYQYLPACKKQLVQRFAATSKIMDQTIIAWNFSTGKKRKARGKAEEEEVGLKRLVKREFEDFGAEEI